MAEKVVNLRLKRKEKARQERKAAADARAAAHGIPKAATELARAREAKNRREHDAHRIDEGEPK